MNMKNILICFYILILFLVSASSESHNMAQKSILSNSGYFAKPVEFDLIADVARHVVSGPLRESSVTLLMEKDENSNSSISDDLIKTVGQTIYLMRSSPVTGPTASKNNSSITEYHQGNLPLITNNVVVMVDTSGTKSNWLHWKPPDSWKTIAFILISSEPSCQRKGLLQTPFFLRAPLAVLICPQESRSSAHSPFLRVWTWKNYAASNQVVDLGIWKSDAFRTWDQLFVDRFDDMSLKTISIYGSPVDRPVFYQNMKGETKGMNYYILKQLASLLKFNFSIYANENASFSDMLDPLKIGDTDMFINFILMTPERNEDYYMTVPHLEEGYGLMVAIPPPLPRWKNVLYPFNWIVWLTILIAITCTSITYHLLYYEHEHSFMNNTISVIQCFLSNPMSLTPTQWRFRSFLLVWWIGSWFIHMSYTCNLIAVLTIPLFPSRIQTMPELADSSTRVCMLDFGDFVPDALRTAKQPVLAGLGRKLDMAPFISEEVWKGFELCVQRVLDGTHAHIDTYSFNKILYSMLGHQSTTYRMRERLYRGYIVFLVYKHSPWRVKFDSILVRYIEAGLVEKWYLESMAEFEDIFHKETFEGQKALSLAHLQGPFYMFTLGVFISVIVMVAELCSPMK